MNNNDQAQFAKDVYQVPESKPELLDTPQLDDTTVSQKFAEIARHEISRTFNDMTQKLEMYADGIQEEVVTPVEVFTPHPDALHLRSKAKVVNEARTTRHKELTEIQTKHGFAKILSPRLIVGTFDSEKSKKLKQAILHDLINQDSKSGDVIYPFDPEVTERKFFHLSYADYDEFFHQQVSVVRSKDFTNSYAVTDYAIQKSSTFFDEVEGRVKNVSVTPSDEEIKNLKQAANLYHDYVMKKVYAKPVPTRRLFGLKSDHDLAA